MTVQTIYLSAGAIEYTYPWTATEATGKDISTSTVALSLGSYTAPGTWRTPDVVSHPQSSQITAQLLIGDTYQPALGVYHLWRDITDNPEILPQRTRLKVIIS